jgi:hypothetical protein
VDRLSLHLIAVKDEHLTALLSDITLGINEVENDLFKAKEDDARKTEALEKA